ncbi:MAG TPA: mechanosensitive ion channel domain-containing protein [Parafilimonas sp.]|nr:mechanosensitive ion channel domain-containing protein [Parafilimonas sp.]
MKKIDTDFYDLAYQWLITHGPKIVIAIIVLIVGEWLIKILRRWSRKFFVAERFEQVRPFLQGLIAVLLQVLLVLLLMQILGIQLTVFTAVIASIGVTAGLALSGTLQNFASGVLILLLKPYKIGDNIVTQSQEGTVSAIQLFYTVVTSYDNKTIIVPNSKLSNEIIINLSRKGSRRIDIELKFNFGIDAELVKKSIKEVIFASKDLATTPEHRIIISALETDGYKMMINVWTAVHGFNDVRYALNEKIMNALKRSGIKLPGM